MAQAVLTPRRRALSRAIKRKIRNTILVTPLVADGFLHHWNFLSRVRACRGAYSSYSEAEAACRAFEHVANIDSWWCGPQIIGEPTHMRKRDYPILLWLAGCLKEDSQILNLGGNVG